MGGEGYFITVTTNPYTCSADVVSHTLVNAGTQQFSTSIDITESTERKLVARPKFNKLAHASNAPLYKPTIDISSKSFF